MDIATLEQIKSDVRRIVPQRLEDAVAALKKYLPEFSPKYSALLLLEGRLHDAHLKNVQNLLSDEALQIEYNQIRSDLLLFISLLEVPDFMLPVGGSHNRNGHLLYRIPNRMQLERETKCVVRLAFEEASVQLNMILDEQVTIKPVRVAEVMQVALIDPNDSHPFVIRTISEQEQFVEKGDYTEWIFYVKPVLAGAFPLVLKISVIEMVQGRERTRNIVWEEMVQIITKSVDNQDSTFKSTGLLIGSAAEEISEVISPAAPTVIRPQVKPMVQLEPTKQIDMAPRRRSNRTWMATAASILLIATVAIFTLQENKSLDPAPHDLIPQPIIAPEQPGVLPHQDSLILDSIRQDSY
ncbi:MAG TPA: hypothetical protein PKD70_03675 [Saprospiraceae bacterium]|nr:hypothetical protein [Saprospiraceae bacterium]HMP12954.1 hypothetical protein [Saprospiraceae bacterium]